MGWVSTGGTWARSGRTRTTENVNFIVRHFKYLNLNLAYLHYYRYQYTVYITPADLHSVPSNRDDVSIVVRAPSAIALRSICE